MAKLYAELASDKDGRTLSKGGNDEITITLNEANWRIFEITFKSNERDAYIDVLRISDGTTHRFHYLDPNIPT